MAPVNRTNRSILFPIVWCVLYVLLLFSILTPLNLITVTVIMVPVFVLYMNLSARWFAAAYAASLLVFYLLTGGLGWVFILLSLFFLPPVIVMGSFHKKGAPAKNALVGGTLTLLAELVILLVAVRLAGVNPVKEFQDSLQTTSPVIWELWQSQFTPEQIDLLMKYVTNMIPFFLVTFSLFYVAVTHWIGRKLANMGGHKLVQPLPPLASWKLPKSLGWYFLVALILDMVMRDPDSFLTMAVMNLFSLLSLAFAIQSLSFLAFWAQKKRKGRFWPALAVLFMIFLPWTMTLFSLLGLMDVMFPVRERMNGKS
ncbi:hypothetical protein J31TS4_39000 [Paenibacillus sp. J31TS4]|uniref:DUF2232 domain-containing protein n=1 Tax=Paenibacillus sp. J31TS4 TaxID=2807195 RepID=UPI001B1D7FF6|nr:DUF2232 domain-containing protein [Paenibacillus sp. J31TS4]GIP40620.1 hypothetical protein J31TS4_39000 [Paenibacillus sp. J31TS4]